MNDLQALFQRYSRRFLALGIIAIALLAAVVLASQADKSVSMWGAKYSLSSGDMIKPGDLEVVKVALGNQSPKYFSKKAVLIGNYLTKAIGQGELIPVSGITKFSIRSPVKEVPVGIAKSDLPSNIKVGDIVDLYSIPTKVPQAISSLIISRISITAIDMQTQNMGGSIDVLFRVDAKELLSITDAIAAGRILVVRNAL